MKQQCSLTDEQIEAIALDTLEFFGQPEYEVALSRAQVLGFARALLDAASRRHSRARTECCPKG
jgi:hypothetical protein